MKFFMEAVLMIPCKILIDYRFCICTTNSSGENSYYIGSKDGEPEFATSLQRALLYKHHTNASKILSQKLSNKGCVKKVDKYIFLKSTPSNFPSEGLVFDDETKFKDRIAAIEQASGGIVQTTYERGSLELFLML